MTTYLVKLDTIPDAPFDSSKCARIKAKSPRDTIPEAFKKFTVPYGKVWLYATDEAGPKHPNGMPMTCHVLELNYGP